MDGVLARFATAGFLALVVFPALLVISTATRGLWTAWAPDELALIEEGGGSPRFAGWATAVIAIGAGTAWVMWQGTWLLSRWTAFKPLPMSFAEPALALVALALAIAVSRPLARGFAAMWRRLLRKRPALLAPMKVVATAGIGIAIVVAVLWKLVIGKRVGPLDLSVLDAPVAAVIGLAIGHLIWAKLPRARAIAGGITGVLAAGVVVCALVAWKAAPSLTLEVWGDRPLAGFAIDSLFDLDGIRDSIDPTELRPVEQPGAAHPDIILVTIDTVRADHTPPYNGGADMPVLRDLGKRGTVYEWAYSPSNVTRRSIPSMIIGRAPDRIKGRVVGWALRVDPRNVMVAERFAAGGYDTAGFVCCEGLYGSVMHTGWARGLAHLEIDPNGLALAKAARQWLEEREKQPNRKPLFLWMHILEPHNWAMATGDPVNQEQRTKLYDKTLATADSMVADLLAPFADRAPDRQPIVVISADHGEALGEHGQPFHSTDLYNSQTHVPLVIAGPGVKQQRIAETVSLIDLVPSLLELGGFQAPVNVDGKSFADLATGKRVQDLQGGVAYSAMIKDRSNPGGVSAIVMGQWKLIETGTAEELYNARMDPNERTNVFKTNPPVAAKLKAALADKRALAKRSPFK
ncbi:MAG: sulfatase-like hydrolase/transferase [Kofleriaceae bacterium]